MKTDAKCYK